MFKKAIGLVILALVLAACGPNSKTPVVRAQPGTGSSLKSIQFNMDITMRSDFGDMGGVSPKGLTTSYFFEEDKVYTRIDIPRAMFPDQQARIVLFNNTGENSRVLFKDSLQPDPTFEGMDLSQMNTPGMPAGLNKLNPFARQTSEDFLTQMRAAAFDVAEETGGLLRVSKKMTLDGIEQKLNLVFDEEVGAVTTIETTITSEEVTNETVAEISYVEVEGVDNAIVPYEIEASTTISLNDQVDPVQFPVSSETLAEGEEITVGENEYIAAEFEGPAVEGLVEVDTFDSEQTVRYEDIEVNTLERGFFFLGGE